MEGQGACRQGGRRRADVHPVGGGTAAWVQRYRHGGKGARIDARPVPRRFAEAGPGSVPAMPRQFKPVLTWRERRGEDSISGRQELQTTGSRLLKVFPTLVPAR